MDAVKAEEHSERATDSDLFAEKRLFRDRAGLRIGKPLGQLLAQSLESVILLLQQALSGCGEVVRRHSIRHVMNELSRRKLPRCVITRTRISGVASFALCVP